MSREEIIAEIVKLFEQLSEENKDRFIFALKQGIECNPTLSEDCPRSVGLEA